MNIQQFGSLPTEYSNMKQHESNLQQSIPSPPCSIPDQQISYTNQQMIIGISSSPNMITHGLFDNNGLSGQQNLLINNNNEFNVNDAAATVAAAEHHMEQQQQIMIQQQQQQSLPFHMFNNMSREELISRLITLEKEKIVENKNNNIEQDEEVVELVNALNNSNTIRTCLWVNCGEKFDVLQNLITHITEAHVGGGKPTYRCEWKNCARNNKPFTKRHKMYNHLRTHTGERPFACPKPDCDKKFSRPDSLTTHIKTHSNVRPFICKFSGCGKAYYHARSLKKHEKTHETINSYQEVISTSTPINIETGLVPTNNTTMNTSLVDQFLDTPFYQPTQYNNNSNPVTFPFSPHAATTTFDNSNFITDFLDSTTSIVQNHQ